MKMDPIRARLPRALAVAALTATAALTALSATAHAGTYVVYGCKTNEAATPLGGTARVWSMSQRYSAFNSFAQTCPNGPIEMIMDPRRTHPADDEMNLTFEAPAGTRIQDFKLWRSVQLSPGYNARLLEYKHSLPAPGYVELDRCYSSDKPACTERGSFSNWADNRNEVSGWARPDTRALQIRITCGRADDSGESCLDGSPAAYYELHRSDIRLVDDHVPTIAAPSGTLVAPGPIKGAAEVTFTASDVGGGVHEAWLVVDGASQPRSVLNANDGLCTGRPWRAAMPCKPNASGSLKLNTLALKDGPHEVKIMVSDPTGTNIGMHGPFRIDVDNAGKGAGGGGGGGEFAPTATAACNPDPQVTTSPSHLLSAGFKSRRHKRKPRTVIATTYKRKLRIHGQLTTADGKPAARAPVCVLVREDMLTAPTLDGGTLTTDDDGRFRYQLPPGPTRTVVFVHRVPAGAVTAKVIARVRAPLTFHVSRRSVRGGRPVTFRGRLLGRPIKDVLVEIQAWDGKRWQEFETRETNATGRYRVRVPTSRSSSTRHLRLRARVRSAASHPFGTGASRTARLTVRR